MTTTIVAISGSYRAASFNHALLRAAAAQAPGGVSITIHDIRDLPFYDGDLEAAGDPVQVEALKGAIADADAVLIATPEYNGGVPGGLKNALDWASRRHPNSVLAGKPVAVIGATPGRGGTVSAQTQLRSVLDRIGAHLVAEPRLELASAFDHITDGVIAESVRSQVDAVVAALVEVAKRQSDRI